MRDQARLPDARIEIESIVDRIGREHPEAGAGFRARVVPINDRFFGRVTDPAWLAFAAVAILVVLISCANVANLMLDRSLHRTRELAIRTSLGASRHRLVRQLLIEATLLAAAGGIVGLAIGVGGVHAFRRAIWPTRCHIGSTTHRHTRRWLCSGVRRHVLVFGPILAFSASKTDVTQVLKTGSPIEGRTRPPVDIGVSDHRLALTVVMLSNLTVGLRIADPARWPNAPSSERTSSRLP